ACLLGKPNGPYHTMAVTCITPANDSRRKACSAYFLLCVLRARCGQKLGTFVAIPMTRSPCVLRGECFSLRSSRLFFATFAVKKLSMERRCPRLSHGGLLAPAPCMLIPPQFLETTMILDLSHKLAPGMPSYPGLPVPQFHTFLAHDDATRQTKYAPGTTFQ